MLSGSLLPRIARARTTRDTSVIARVLSGPTHRQYAASSSNPPNPQTKSSNRARKQITVTSDTGQVPWRELTLREKAARGTQQSVNSAIVLLGVGLTVGVVAILWLEVVSPESKTAVFNAALDKVRAHPLAVRALVGNSGAGRIEGHGETSLTSRLDRNRTAASRIETDQFGSEHMHMHFYVSGPANKGTVRVHMVRRKDSGDTHWATHSISLDVQGHGRIWIESASPDVSGAVTEGKSLKDVFGREGRLFGVRIW